MPTKPQTLNPKTLSPEARIVFSKPQTLLNSFRPTPLNPNPNDPDFTLAQPLYFTHSPKSNVLKSTQNKNNSMPFTNPKP